MPLHISQLEFLKLIETKVCAYTEIVCLWTFFKRIFEILCIFRLINNILHKIWRHIFTVRNDAKMNQWSAFGPTTSNEPLDLNQAFSRANAYLSVRIYFWSKLLCTHRNCLPIKIFNGSSRFSRQCFRLINSIVHYIWPHVFAAKMDQWSAFGPTRSLFALYFVQLDNKKNM